MAEGFIDAARAARARAEQGDLDGAIALLETRRPAFPFHAGLFYLTEAELFARARRERDALDALERGLAAGCRYKKEWLVENKALAALGAADGFADLAARAQRAYEQAASAAKPHLTFALPDTLPDAFGYPLLLVLHGNNSNAKETAPYWSALADRGWVVAVPQSSEIGTSPDAYTWSDRAKTASELDLHLDRLKRATQVDVSRIVLAGFSMGATHAIALALTKRLSVRGIVPICPWLPRIDEFGKLIEGGAARMLRTYVVVGAGDPSRDGARALVDVMTRHGIRAQLDEREGVAHEYPPDMDDTLAKALAFATT